jgi:hypothetical protein
MKINCLESANETRQKSGKKCICVGTMCICDRCLYYLGLALMTFVLAGPAAFLSQGHVEPAVTIALGVLAGASLLMIGVACAVNFWSALNRKHYHRLRDSTS